MPIYSRRNSILLPSSTHSIKTRHTHTLRCSHAPSLCLTTIFRNNVSKLYILARALTRSHVHTFAHSHVHSLKPLTRSHVRTLTRSLARTANMFTRSHTHTFTRAVVPSGHFAVSSIEAHTFKSLSRSDVQIALAL